MTNKKKLEKLIADLDELANKDSSPERDHGIADDLLLAYIDNIKVTSAFERIEKWYS